MLDSDAPHSKTIFGWKISNARESVGEGNLCIPSVQTDIQLCLDSDILSRHMLVLGGVGMGKTNFIFGLFDKIKQNLGKDDVVIVFDTKGDYIKEFFQEGDAYISNREMPYGGRKFWNIFSDILFRSTETSQEEVESVDVNDIIVELVKTMFDEYSAKTRDFFFPAAARDLTSAVIKALIRRADPSELDNRLIRHYLYEDMSELESMLEAYPDLKGALQYVSNRESNQTQGVKSFIKLAIAEIFSGTFSKNGDFSIREFVKKRGGKTLFIEYDPATSAFLTPTYRMLFDLAIKEALIREELPGSVYFIIDEFALLPRLYYIQSGVNFGRSYGLKFIVGAQSMQQVNESYGNSNEGGSSFSGNSLLAGFSTLISFRVFDRASMDFLEDRFGSNIKLITYMNKRGGGGIETSVHESKVIEDRNIYMLKRGESIICLPNTSPIRFKFQKYESRRKSLQS